MKTFAAVALSSALVAPAAFAAGPTPVVVEPAVVAPVAVFTPVTPDWTGFYVGGQIGYGDLDADNGTTSSSVSGATYGLLAGYNYDFRNNFVLGAEVSYDWSDISGSGIEVDNLTTLKAKAGYTVGSSLLYATAGWSWADASFAGNDYSDNGWVAGVGVDYLLNPNWIVGAEVLYRDFSDFDGTGVDADGTTFAVKAAYRF